MQREAIMDHRTETLQAAAHRRRRTTPYDSYIQSTLPLDNLTAHSKEKTTDQNQK